MVLDRFDHHVEVVDCHRIEFWFLFLYHMLQMLHCKSSRMSKVPSLHLLDMEQCYS